MPCLSAFARRSVLALFSLFSLVSLLATAAPVLRVEQGFSYPTPAAGIPAGGYLTVVNNGPADLLLAVESPLVGRIEIHEMSTEDGLMRMRRLPDGLPVAAQSPLELAPGGYHLMLLDSPKALAVGDRIPLVLVFEKAGRVPAELTVRSRNAEPHAHH